MSLVELEEQWSLDDWLDAWETLDLCDELERKANQPGKG